MTGRQGIIDSIILMYFRKNQNYEFETTTSARRFIFIFIGLSLIELFNCRFVMYTEKNNQDD
jgi:hypothetical protein